jgi:hypothetical protein
MELPLEKPWERVEESLPKRVAFCVSSDGTEMCCLAITREIKRKTATTSNLMYNRKTKLFNSLPGSVLHLPGSGVICLDNLVLH